MDYGEKDRNSPVGARRHPWWERDPTFVPRVRSLLIRTALVLALCAVLLILSVVGSALSGR
jgi:hypothetical protein